MDRATFEQALRTTALSWEGVQYRHLGRDRTGIDCLGLLLAVFSVFGNPASGPEPDEYYDYNWHLSTTKERYLLGLLKYSRKVPESGLRPGCLILFRISGDRGTSSVVNHAGIFIGQHESRGDAFVHALGTINGGGRVRVGYYQHRFFRNAIHSFVWPSFLDRIVDVNA